MNSIQAAEYEVEKMKEYNTELTSYANQMKARSSKDKLKEFADFRKFKMETVEKADIFYVGEMTEMLLPDYFDRVADLGVISETNNKPIFRNRWVIPIKNPEGLVQNFVGYSPAYDERYIYGTSKYYRRKATVYGLENLNLAYEMGYAFITEGITDTIRLRDMGYPNSFAMCGTHSSEFIIRQLNRCRNGVILIPDRDDPGLKALKDWKFHRSVTIFINFQYKDVDEMCRESEDNQEWFKDYATNCIEWIKKDVHNGSECLHETVTIL